MRFLFLTQYFPPEIGAPQVRLAALVRELIRLGHEVEVVTALPNHPTGRIFPEYRGKWYVREAWEGVPVHRIWLYASIGAGIRRVFNYMSYTFTSLIGLMCAKHPDYIFVESPPLFLSIPGWVASRIWQVPMIFNVADLWPDSVRDLGLMKNGALLKFAYWLEAWSYRKAAFINAVTEGIRTTLVNHKGLPIDKVLFLPNGVDTELFRSREPDLDLQESLGLLGKKVILYAGTHGFAHGLEVAIKAAKILESQGSNIQFVFVGDGSEKARIVNMAQAMDCNNVRFLDPSPPSYIARLYSFSIAGLSTLKNNPLFEGTRPVKIFSAMASGKPVIYSGAGEGARLIESAKAGLVVPPGDPEALAEAVRNLVSNPSLAEELGRNGRRYVEENLSWSALVSDWLEQLGERRGGGAA